MRDPVLFGAAYYPEDWPEAERPKDIAMMKKAGMNVMRFAEFAWYKMEPRPGEYHFEWLHEVVDDLAKNGISSILGTPTATPPRWFLKQYPDAAKLLPEGYRQPHGGRRHCCSNNPDYQRESLRIVEAMAREFGGDPHVIGWQLDNEIYTRGAGCVCPYCVENFHRFLQKKYGTVEKLNEAWNLNVFSQAYDAFEDIPAPVHGWQNPHIRLAWNQAHFEADIQFIHAQLAVLKKYTKAPVGTDMMPFNDLSHEEMVAPLDVAQFNHYNHAGNLPEVLLWFDHFRSFEKPFWNTETSTCWCGSNAVSFPMQPEGFCRINSWLPVALGGEANLYWLWRQHWAGHELMHGSVLYANGRPMHIFPQVQQVAKEFEIAGDFLRETRVESDLAIHFTSRSWQLFEVEPMLPEFSYRQQFRQSFYCPVTEMGLRPDVIGAQKSLEEYKLLFSPLVMTLEDGDLGDRIEEWVQNGGIWIAGPMTDIRNEIGAHYIDRAMGRIERMTGAALKVSLADSGDTVRSAWKDGTAVRPNLWQELYTPVGEVLAEVKEGFGLEGCALVQKIPCGKGSVWLLGTIPSKEDLQKLIRMACAEAGVSIPRVTGNLAVVPRKGAVREGLILAELAHAPASYVLEQPMTDLLTGKTYEGKIELNPYDLLVLEK